MKNRRSVSIPTAVAILLLSISSPAQDRSAVLSPARGGHLQQDSYNGRDILVYVPSRLPAAGHRAMVVALHGGMGNAHFLQAHLKMDEVAEKYGFLVAYLNGSPATRRLSDRFHAWNAGSGCCGKPYADDVDDIGYVGKAVEYLSLRHGIDPAKIFGTGHSNGAMMTLTLLCKTNIYRKAVSLAGSLMVEGQKCPAASGKEVLAIHGNNDRNVLPEGGIGPKGISRVLFHSQADSQARFQGSGGRYDIDWVESDHALEHIAAAVEKREGRSLAEKIAHFFGLTEER